MLIFWFPGSYRGFQHLPTLGKAYLLTGDERYVREFTSEISDWIAKNPYRRGINWRCPMEVAIRSVNWLWGYQYFRDSPLIDKAFLQDFLRSLILHGRHLRANPERNSALVEFLTSLLVSRQSPLASIKRARAPTTNNHYLSDVAGLIYLGIMLGGIKEAESWRRLGMRELIKEMAKQVYPDGVAYEGSIAYHHLQAEIFLSTTIILQKNGFKLPGWYLKRLEKMLEFTRYYTRPDGNAPQIGDTDDGRFHILSRYGDWNKRDHRHLLSVGAVVFNRPDFWQGSDDEEAILWLCGKDGVIQCRNMMSPAPSPSSLAFRRAGFYVLRKDALYMMVDCIQDDARAPRGHRHNSRLSFELYAYDKAFIVDPGTYTYVTGEGMRNLFRSTACHNTVTVDGEEQNRFRQPRFVEDLFDMYNDARVMVREWTSNEEYDFLDAEHSGYERLAIASKAPAANLV